MGPSSRRLGYLTAMYWIIHLMAAVREKADCLSNMILNVRILMPRVCFKNFQESCASSCLALQDEMFSSHALNCSQFWQLRSNLRVKGHKIMLECIILEYIIYNFFEESLHNIAMDVIYVLKCWSSACVIFGRCGRRQLSYPSSYAKVLGQKFLHLRLGLIWVWMIERWWWFAFWRGGWGLWMIRSFKI